MPDLRPIRALPCLALALAGTGCHAARQLKDKSYDGVRSLITSSYHDPDPDAKMAAAEALFNDGKYVEAQELFAKLADNTYNPVLLSEKARFLEAECLRLRGRGFDAVAHYNKMLTDFPAGVYREQGCARIYDAAYGWLKEGTLADIEDNLAGKARPWWEKPRLPNFTNKDRPTLDGEGEALKYLEAVHTHDLTGPTADRALFWCGYVNFYRGNYEEADHFFSQIVELHKDSPLWKEAVRLAVIAKNNSTGGAVYDSQKASEALQLVHHVEATVPEYTKDPEKASWLLRQKMAVRVQLAEKDYQAARYYERTGHPASAYFYYELVARRYSGTKFADLAKERIEGLKAAKAQADADKAAGKVGTGEALKQEWAKLTGQGEKPADPLKDATAPPAAPEAPPKMLPQMDANGPK